MRDTIYRDDAIRVASGFCHWTNIPKELAKLPSAEPERKRGQWIPCSERLPEKDGYYLATCERFGWNAEKEKEIFTDVVELFRGDWLEPGKVVAWMPLPEPYKGGE